MERRRFLGQGGGAALGAGHPALGAILSGPVSGGHGASSVTRSRQPDPRFDEISNLVEAKMAEYRITGVVFGLSKKGASQLRGFGLTNIDNPQPVTPDTVFPIASISKTVVGTAMMRLHDQGLVDVEAPVREYITDFQVGDA